MPGNCAVYMPLRMFPTAEQLSPLCGGARVSVDQAAQVATLQWPDRTLRMTRMPEGQMGEHLQGLVGYIRSKGGSEALVLRALHTMSVLGMTVEPDFDPHGVVMDFVGNIIGASDGFCFLGGELYGTGGQGLLFDEAGRLRPPAAARVACRAQVLLALAVRGLLEQDVGKADEALAETARAELVSALWSPRSGPSWRRPSPRQQPSR
jgi:hypothetical protein